MLILLRSCGPRRYRSPILHLLHRFDALPIVENGHQLADRVFRSREGRARHRGECVLNLLDRFGYALLRKKLAGAFAVPTTGLHPARSEQVFRAAAIQKLVQGDQACFLNGTRLPLAGYSCRKGGSTCSAVE